MNIPLQYLTIKTKNQNKAFDFVIDDPFADGTGGDSNITKLSQLENDTGFITRTVTDLVNYYDKTAVDNKLSAVPKFSIAVVQSLPTSNISATTVYLVPSEQGENNVYEEYIYVDGKWEKLGSQKVDLTDYYTRAEVNSLVIGVEAKIPTKLSQMDNDAGYAKKSELPTSLPASDVPEWAKQTTPPTYNKSDVGLGNVANERQYSEKNPPPYPVTSVNGKTGDIEAEPKGTAAERIAAHNAQSTAHNDIRLLISALTQKVNDLLDSDDTTLDQMSEIVAYIKANRELLESYTTEKVNVADIIDNLTTSVSNKPLSAKQGVQLKALIDAIKVPTKLNELAEDSTHRTVTDTEKNTWNNKSDFSGSYTDLSNKPTIPTKLSELAADTTHRVVTDAEKTAWNAKSNFSGVYSDLSGKPTKVSAFENDANYMKSTEQQSVIDTALAQAKASGDFDGEDGERGTGILKVTTSPSSYTTTTGGFTPTHRIALSDVLTQAKVSKVLIGDTLAYNYYQYIVGYIDSGYVYIGSRSSVRGATGPAYTLTDEDKAAIVDAVIDSLPTEEWTFTLDDGTTVVKEVFIK